MLPAIYSFMLINLCRGQNGRFPFHNSCSCYESIDLILKALVYYTVIGVSVENVLRMLDVKILWLSVCILRTFGLSTDEDKT